MQVPDDYERRLELAEQDELKLRDTDDGFVYWVDSYDEDGVYYHADEGGTHRATHDQLKAWFEFVEA